MRKTLCVLALASIAALSPVALRASEITYLVNEAVGAGSVTGFITTDGTLGTLGTANIVNWDLNLNNGSGGTFELLSSNSQKLINGADLTATASQLLYNYSNGDGGLFLLENSVIGDGGPAVCWANSSSCMNAPAGVMLAALQGEGDIVHTELQGTGVIGNQGEVAATPEPSSFLLLGTGLAGFAGMLRRKFAR